MSIKANTSTVSISFTGLLTLLFIALKLIPYKGGTVIDWSWWWVLSPLWISWLLGTALFIVCLLVILVVSYTVEGER